MEKNRSGCKFPIQTEANIASAYEMGVSIVSICGRFGCSRDTIYRIIKSYGIPTRTKYPKNTIRRKNEQQLTAEI